MGALWADGPERLPACHLLPGQDRSDHRLIGRSQAIGVQDGDDRPPGDLTGEPDHPFCG